MLENFVAYNDLCLEIELLKEQIKLTENELKYWFGDTIPFGSFGVHKFGANTGLVQAEKKIDTLNKQNERLKELEVSRVRIYELLNQFKGLEYKIARMRYVEGKSLKEIALELGYSEGYIRNVMCKIKNSS